MVERPEPVRLRGRHGLAATSTVLAILGLGAVLLDLPWVSRAAMRTVSIVNLLAALMGLAAVILLGMRRSWLDRLCCGLAGAGLLLGGLQCVFVPAVSRVPESARRATCKSNLRQIGLAILMYAEDSDGRFPPNFAALYPTYVDNPKVFSRDDGDT